MLSPLTRAPPQPCLSGLFDAARARAIDQQLQQHHHQQHQQERLPRVELRPEAADPAPSRDPAPQIDVHRLLFVRDLLETAVPAPSAAPRATDHAAEPPPPPVPEIPARAAPATPITLFRIGAPAFWFFMVRVMGVVIAHDFVDDADEMREAAIIDDGTGGIAVAPSQLLMSTNIMRRIPPGTMIEVSGILCMPTAPSEHRWIHSYGITAKTDPHAELIRLDEVIQLYSEDYFKGKFAGATAPPSFTQPPPGLFGNRKRPASTTPRAPAASSYRPQNAFSSPLRGPFQPAGTPRKTLGIARMAAGSSATPPSRKLAGDGGGLGRPTPPPKPFKPPMAAFQQTAAAESPARALCASPSVVAQAAATLQDVDSFLQTKQGLGVSRGDVLAAFPRTSHSVIDGILNELLSEGIAYISESLYFPL